LTKFVELADRKEVGLGIGVRYSTRRTRIRPIV
jgi:hypothetical protein